MVQPIHITSTLTLIFPLTGIICCIAYRTAPLAFLFIATLIIIILLISQCSLGYFLLEKKEVLSMIVLALWLLFAVYDMVMGLSLLIYLSEYQQGHVGFNSGLLPFMIDVGQLDFTGVAWINLVFYFGNAFATGFHAREYYRIFWVNSIVYIYRYLKKRVKNMNETLLTGLPVIPGNQELYGAMCSLCLENYNEIQPITKLMCGHLYHRNCIRIWVMKSNCCPLCRRRVIFK